MTEIGTIDWRWGTSVFSENTALFSESTKCLILHIGLMMQTS